ncbi:hypothetical protein [Streptomyces sp. NPDC060035]|uniref:hypothetical protein n=1 Tax=Streptomyces sp. NPDC060035 TaxID=3347044 RepID=UPI0036D18ABD
MPENTTVTYEWRATVMTVNGVGSRERTYAGKATGGPGYSTEDAKKAVSAWLCESGVHGVLSYFTAARTAR